jgi:hypothetical protein
MLIFMALSGIHLQPFVIHESSYHEAVEFMDLVFTKASKFDKSCINYCLKYGGETSERERGGGEKFFSITLTFIAVNS